MNAEQVVLLFFNLKKAGKDEFIYIYASMKISTHIYGR